MITRKQLERLSANQDMNDRTSSGQRNAAALGSGGGETGER
jgi:hypothetical protein